jgi:amidohydrolase
MPSILEESKALSDQIINWRRHFHANPELGFQEKKTGTFIFNILQDLGMKPKSEVGRTGVVASIGSGNPCIALRADMDALPIQDSKEAVEYKSTNQGVMHACGHDAHVAMLLGAATILTTNQSLIPDGQIRFLFQPYEEGQDKDGIGGADAMMKDNALEGVDVIIGQHVHAELDAGAFQIKNGYFSAAVDTFYGEISGKGCHGAYPHEGIDPIFISAQVINAVQGIISRRIDPLEPGVISFGKIHAGTAANIIPPKVKLSGTIRSLNPEIRTQLKKDLEKAFQLSRNFGGNYKLKIIEGYPSINNNDSLVKLLREVASDFLQSDKVLEGGLGMGAEDFSVYLRNIPGAFFYLGTALDQPRMHHAPDFDINDSVLYLGTALIAETAVRFLKNPDSIEIS